MNNSEFRSLLQKESKPPTDSSGNGASFKKPSLGSRSRASIPMTPRSVMGRNASNEFARQVAEQTKGEHGEPPTKKFKSSHAPKGTKLAQGYNDRTSTRNSEEEESDKSKKLKELEQMVKDEKIDRATFEKLRDKMGIGGDLSTTHLVKGLDFKLLDKARRGDDLNEASKQQEKPKATDDDVDDELDNVMERDITARKPTSHSPEADVEVPVEARSMSRDEILRRLKEGRNAGNAPAPDPVLGDRFKKLAPVEKPGRKKFVETIDGRRREVLIVTKDDGTTKRKTRWLDPEPPPQKPQAPLGMEVPAEILAKQKALAEQEAAEDDDEDIFAGVGADYDPLKGIDSDAEDEKPTAVEPDDAIDSRPRNYFSTNQEVEDDKQNPIMQDPTLLAALKRAAALRQDEEGAAAGDSRPDPNDKSRQFLDRLKERERQDAQDMDLGFGDSRFADDDEDDGPIYKDGDEQGKQKRKRGPKKRKGNKDNVADVMSVLDGRKK